MPAKSTPYLLLASLPLCLAATGAASASDPSSALPLPLVQGQSIAASTEPQGLEAWRPRDSDLRILELRVGSYTLDEVVGAYQYQDVILLPLGGLANILDLAVDVGAEVASGFVIRESNTFYLDPARSEITLRGVLSRYPADLVQVLEDDIYVESSLLGKWLNMAFDIDLYGARIWVRSEEKLPFLARIEREKRIAKSLASLNMGEDQYPRHHESYQSYSLPFFDQNIGLGKRYNDAGEVTTLLSTTHATGDLFMHESNWYLTLNEDDGIDDFRVTLGRTDPDGELLGSLHARQYQFGDVAEPRLGLITAASKLEQGVVVSSFPVGVQFEYDRHRFTGELLPGWEVELYRNNALIGYQQTPENGQYDFQDVPLLYGSNHFRLVFYGPRGEIRELEEHFDLTQALTRQGELYYRGSVIRDEHKENRSTIQFDYGLAKNISTSLKAASLPLQEGTAFVQHNYVAADVTGYWDALLASVTLVEDSESGHAMMLDLKTRFDTTTIALTDILLNEFVSEEYLPTAQPVERRSEVVINTAIPETLTPRIPVTLGYKRDLFSDGSKLVELSNQLSLSMRGFAITNELTHQQYNAQPATAMGSLRLSTNINNMRLRSTLAYTLKPEDELTNVALSLDPGRLGDYRINLGVNHSLPINLTEYSVNATKISGKYGLSLGASYNTEDEISLALNLSFGFGYEPRRKQWRQAATSVANQGSLSARFFLDADQDGIFGDGDEPLEDIGLRVNGGYNVERSDADGILYLTGIPAYQSTDITIAPETLVDPLWRAALDGIQVVPRPGHAIEFDFPIFMSGEIDGTVYLKKNGREFGVGDVTVELVDEFNRVVATTKTAYDGFYILSKAPLGEYRVRVAKQPLSQLGVRSMNEESLTISNDEPFISGIDFYLEAK